METQTIESKLAKVKSNRGLALIVIELLKRDIKEIEKNDLIKDRDIVLEWIDKKLINNNYKTLTIQGLECSRFNISTIRTKKERELLNIN